jgi:hypothetical protein
MRLLILGGVRVSARKRVEFAAVTRITLEAGEKFATAENCDKREKWRDEPDRPARLVLLNADDHGIGTDQVFDAGLAESRLFHPSHAIGAGVVETARSLDQHVEAHQQAKGVL